MIWRKHNGKPNTLNEIKKQVGKDLKRQKIIKSKQYSL